MTTTTLPESEPANFWGDIARVAGILSSEHFPTGDRAALKRMAPDSVPPLAFYRFAFRELTQGWESRGKAWQTLIAGMSITSNLGNPHNRQRPLGRVLAEHRFSEARLERLLATEGDTLQTLLLRAVRFLAAKGETFDWTDCARLLLAGEDHREQIRREIARDYYRTLKENRE